MRGLIGAIIYMLWLTSCAPTVAHGHSRDQGMYRAPMERIPLPPLRGRYVCRCR
jgi:hypothetical protein